MRKLALYVDGALEQSGTEDDDAKAVPKTPEAKGQSVVRSCSDSLCEEGMHIGGLYCCSGGGYTGRFLNGTLDELRIWSRALPLPELREKMYRPLNAGENKGLLFYFPFDDAGMESGANVVESRALPWYGILGNARGGGRPAWTVSSSPLSCTKDNKAQVCLSLAGGELSSSAPLGALGSPSTSTAASITNGVPPADGHDDDQVSFAAVLFLLVLTAITSALVAGTLTYMSLQGALPSMVSNPFSSAGSAARNGYGASSGMGTFSARTAPPGHDWRWAAPPRQDQQQMPGTADPAAATAPQPESTISAAAEGAPPPRPSSTSYGSL